jgi:hypothetical protein
MYSDECAISEEEQMRLMEADQTRHPENYPSIGTSADDGPMTREDYQQAIREWAEETIGPGRIYHPPIYNK